MRNQHPSQGGAGERDHAELLDRIDRMAMLLDSRFRIPFTRVHFGWDAIAGLVPVAGDLVALAMSIYLVSTARKIGLDGKAKGLMAFNVVLDAAIGAIPLVGTVFDVLFRANERNLKVLVDQIERRRAASAREQRETVSTAP